MKLYRLYRFCYEFLLMKVQFLKDVLFPSRSGSRRGHEAILFKFCDMLSNPPRWHAQHLPDNFPDPVIREVGTFLQNGDEAVANQ